MKALSFYYNYSMRVLLFSLLLLGQAPAYARYVKKPAANIADRPAPLEAPAPLVLTRERPNFCIMGAQSGKPFQSEAALNSLVWKNDVVYVGETHDEPLDHLAQLDALKAMKTARGSKLAVGFEMLEQPLQPALDEYAAGKLSEEDFLDKADWRTDKRFDFKFYKPLFDLIRQHKLRALALNVPAGLIKKIAGDGLASLTPEERQALPENIEPTTHKKYNEYLKTSFSEHDGSKMAKTVTFDNYTESMAAWNEGMGARVAAFLAENPGYSVLVITGNGHIVYNAAIPASVKARVKGVRQASFYTQTAEKCPEIMPAEHKDLANYIWYLNRAPKQEPAAAAAATAAPPPAAPAVSTAPVPSPPPAAEPGK